MKKKLFKILLALTIVLSSTFFLSELCFAQGEKYLLSETGGNVLKATNDANDLITYMNDSSHFDQAKSYTLTLNDDLVIPFEGSKLKTLEIHSNLTIEGNYKTITGDAGGAEGDRFIKAKTEKISLNINNLNFVGSEKYAGIHVETEGDTPINFNLDKCNFTKCRGSYGACIYIAAANVNIKSCEFTDSKGNNGGAIHYASILDTAPSDKFLNTKLNLYRCNFDGCIAYGRNGYFGGNGGAFYMSASDGYSMKNDFIFKECSFNNCSAKEGGAINLLGIGKLVFEDTNIDNCHAEGFGGAIHAQLANKIEFRSTDKNNIYGITNCKSDSFGGAIFMRDSFYNDNNNPLGIVGLVIKDYKIEDCKAEGAGAIGIDGVDVDIDNLSIKNCKAKMAGAIYGDLLSGSIKNSEFINNKVEGYDEYNIGGAICIESAGTYTGFSYKTLEIEDTKFEGNKAPKGGAIFFRTKYSGIEIKGKTIFLNNESPKGGAICLAEGTMNIKNTEIKKNKAISSEEIENSGNGAAIYVGPTAYGEDDLNRTLNISEGSVITDNHADNFGGGIYSNKGTVNIDKSTIEKNTALKGAGLYINSSENTITSSNIVENNAKDLGGGIYNEYSMPSVKSSTIEKNTALNGGGIYIKEGLIKLDESVINENEARFSIVDELDEYSGETKKVITGKGAGLYLSPAAREKKENKITNTKFTNNKAGSLGGGIYFLGEIYDLLAQYDPNTIKYGTELIAHLPYVTEIKDLTFKGNTAGFDFYNPPNDIATIKQGQAPVSEDDYKALMSANNSCKDKLIIKDADGKWQHIESLINNYDIDYINPITTTTYMENFGENGIYVNQELTTKDYQDQDTNVINGHELKVVSYEKTKLKENPDTTKPFKIWNTEKNGKGTDRKVDAEISGHKGNMTLFAQWGAKPVPPTPKPSEPTKYILRLDENYSGGEIRNIEVEEGELIAPHLYIPRRGDYIFRGWSYDQKHLDEVKPEDRIYTDKTLYAIWEKADEEKVEKPERRERPERSERPKGQEEAKEIKGEEHKAYIFGYPNGTVRPKGSITRAEAAAMLSRLLNIETMGSAEKPNFTDTESAWYNKAINAVVARGIMKGYPDGRFKPNAPITRAEFTQMISTIDNKPYGEAPFVDVAGHWAERAIGSEYQAKRITGYPDGLFRPNANITRAEAAVILNKIFERNYDASSILKCKNPQMINRFTDLQETFWGYNDMVEATNAHEYLRRYKDQNMNRIEEDWLFIK